MYFKLFMHICCIYVAVTAYAYLMHVQVVSVTALSQQARGEPEMFKLSLENRENNIQDVTVAYFVHIFMQILCIFCSYFTYSSFLHNFLHIVHICCIFFCIFKPCCARFRSTLRRTQMVLVALFNLHTTLKMNKLLKLLKLLKIHKMLKKAKCAQTIPPSSSGTLGHCYTSIALFLAIYHLGYIAPAKLLYSKGAISILCYIAT